MARETLAVIIKHAAGERFLSHKRRHRPSLIPQSCILSLSLLKFSFKAQEFTCGWIYVPKIDSPNVTIHFWLLPFNARIVTLELRYMLQDKVHAKVRIFFKSFSQNNFLINMVIGLNCFDAKKKQKPGMEYSTFLKNIKARSNRIPYSPEFLSEQYCPSENLTWENMRLPDLLAILFLSNGIQRHIWKMVSCIALYSFFPSIPISTSHRSPLIKRFQIW